MFALEDEVLKTEHVEIDFVANRLGINGPNEPVLLLVFFDQIFDGHTIHN